MSLEIRPLAALYPPTPYMFFKADIIERGANAVGMSIPPPATTESRDRERSPIKHFYIREGGYNAARGIISREITKNITNSLSILFRCSEIFTSKRIDV